MRAPLLTFKRARALRRNLTLPEGLLWRELRKRAADGLRFRRQHPVGPYILDFYCPSARLAVEVDGAAHHTPDAARHDDRRDEWLAGHGIRVLRVPANAVLDDEQIEGVLQSIVQAAAPSTAFGGPPPPLRG